jgi:hypothetical protein
MARRTKYEQEHGILTIEESEFTKCSVQLIDVSKLDTRFHDGSVIIAECAGAHTSHDDTKPLRRLIINIDYAFGRQVCQER